MTINVRYGASKAFTYNHMPSWSESSVHKLFDFYLL